MQNKKIKLSVFAIVGAIIGFSYYYFIGCYNGHCLISSNPFISTSYGMVFGLILAWDNKKVNKGEKSEVS